MLYNGFGEHNIQGIGDKHIPLIHNVMTTDVALAVSDRRPIGSACSSAPTSAARTWRGAGGVPDEVARRAALARALEHLQHARRDQDGEVLGLGPEDVIVTVATDGAAMYGSERELALAEYFPDGFDEVAAAEVFGEHLLGATTDHLASSTHEERERIFNLGYFTWVEQQGVSLEDFEAAHPASGARCASAVAGWDELIDEFNARTGVLEAL